MIVIPKKAPVTPMSVLMEVMASFRWSLAAARSAGLSSFAPTRWE